MKPGLLLTLLPMATMAFAPSSKMASLPSPIALAPSVSQRPSSQSSSQMHIFKIKGQEETEAMTTTGMEIELEASEGLTEAKKIELIALGIWGISISAFILINNFVGPWPAVMKLSLIHI